MSQTSPPTCPFEWFFFDFGGVIADEGFVLGLQSLGRAEGIDPDLMRTEGVQAVFSTGFVLGQADEGTFWRDLKKRTGLQAEDAHCRKTVLDSFVVRPWMLQIVHQLRKNGRSCAILSDQVTWLDILDKKHGIFQHFDRVFNSFHLGKSKRDPSLFTDVLNAVQTRAEQALFVDDSEDNIQRAQEQGLKTIHYQSKDAFLHCLHQLCPCIHGL